MRFKSNNPSIKESMFTKTYNVESSETMTIRGAINKTILMIMLVILSATFTWKYMVSNPALLTSFMLIGGIGGFIVALITIFKKEISNITAPIYALLEGLFLGAISAFVETIFPGIAFQAMGLTFAIALFLFVAYKAGWIKATAKFRSGIIAATGGIAIFYILSIVLSLFGINFSVFQLGWLGVGIQLFIVVIAALNLILDFDMIEKGESMGAPKFMEWYSAFSLSLTLVWLYLEILRLLMLVLGKD